MSREIMDIVHPDRFAGSGGSSAEGGTQAAAESDWEDVSAKGEMTIGMTLFAPMNYYDENNNFVGFDTDICVVSNALLIKTTFYAQADVYVSSGCCAGTTEERHNAALDVMRSCQISVEE